MSRAENGWACMALLDGVVCTQRGRLGLGFLNLCILFLRHRQQRRRRGPVLLCARRGVHVPCALGLIFF